MSISFRNKLDHDIGYIRKSPCRDCGLKKRLPDCSNNCKTLNQLQANLVFEKSHTNNYSELESFYCHRGFSDQ
jgi:hypothetical protein